MALTAKQARFVDEYLVDLNATQAAIRAGYSKRTAYSIGQENLRKPEIAAALAEAQQKRSERTGITADRVIAELARIGFFDIRKAIEWGGGEVRFIPSSVIDDDTAAAIQEVQAEITQAMVSDDEDAPIMQTVKMKLKVASKISALTKLGEHLGIFQSEVQKAPPAPPEPATYVARDMSKPSGATDGR